MARFKVRGGGKRGICRIPYPKSRLQLQLAVIGAIVFIIYISFKILQPEISSSDLAKDLPDSRIFVDHKQHNEMQNNNVEVRIIGFPPEVVNLGSNGPRNGAIPLEQVRDHLIDKYRVNITASQYSHDSLWKMAEEWVQSREIVPRHAPELGAVLHAMATAPITAVDVGYKGTQLKLSMELGNKQRVVFKPMWYKRDYIVEGEPYAGRDRHNAEVAAFHLSRILELRRVPLAVGRTVNISRDIAPVASQTLLKTFYQSGSNICFYGKCYYCRPDSGVCAEEDKMEGTVILWLPAKFTLNVAHHPWSRKYRANVQAKWETDNTYCKQVLEVPLYKTNFFLLLDIIDTAIFDFLIGNADRHHYETFSNIYEGMLIILDNGKSFGNPYHDEISILAPLYQCCLIRYSTRQQLLTLKEGLLSSVLREVLKSDPIHPVLAENHLAALDRRLVKVLDEIETCIKANGIDTIVMDKT